MIGGRKAAPNIMAKTLVENLPVKRGCIYRANLNPVCGSEQGGIRPVLVLQNDVGNKFSSTTIIAAITSKKQKANLPTHVSLPAKQYGLTKNSIILLEQIRTIDKHRLKSYITCVDQSIMAKVEEALAVSLGVEREDDCYEYY